MAKLRFLIKCIFGLLFVFAGILHFTNPEMYLKIMPPYVPYHQFMVLISGVAEIVLGFLLLFSVTQKIAGWGLVWLLLAVFPANIYMAQHPEIFSDIPAWGLYLRLPLQGIMILWAYYYTQKVV